MRLTPLIPALAFLMLGACDSNGALKIALAPTAPVAANCCCATNPAVAACPTTPPPAAAAPAAAPPPAMAPEPAAYRPAAHRVRARQVAHREGHYRDEGHQQAYAGGYVAVPARDEYVEIPASQIYGQGQVVELREVYQEAYSERAQGYGEEVVYESPDAYARHHDRSRGCDRGCAPAEAAGRDRYGFLTWPGKVPARP